MFPTLPPMYGNSSNRNRPRPLNPLDSALTTGLVSNPNGTYVSNPFPTTAQNGQQGQFGAMLPQVNVSPLHAAIQSGAMNAPIVNPATFQPFRLPPVMANGGMGQMTAAQLQQITQLNQPNPIQPPFRDPKDTQPATSTGLPQPGTEASQALAQTHYKEQLRIQEQRTVTDVLARLESGDMSAIADIPAADLEAMGLGFLANYGAGGGGNQTSTSGGAPGTEGIGTWVDEGKDMTPEQLESRYYKNKAFEVEFLRASRWDAKRKKYISVGQWMRQERNSRNKHGRKKNNNPKPKPAAVTEGARFTNSVEGNFNTGTG